MGKRTQNTRKLYATLGVFGQLFLMSGLVLVLFVVYQLWGTGLQTRAAQQRLAETFETQLSTSQPVAEVFQSLQQGDPVARLEIPKIGVDYIVSEGVELSVLESGPGRFPQTAFPGQSGNAAIAGHRSTYDAPPIGKLGGRELAVIVGV